jgi:TP53 regulating kinase-like protein
MVLLRKGAEASLFLEEWHNRRVIMKHRFPKKYRFSKLDMRIRSDRTIHEPQIMNQAKAAGVATPTIFRVDVENGNIIMEFVEGKQVKEIFYTLSKNEKLFLCKKIGKMIGRLHQKGIIHGDLTTSNMILTPFEKIVFIDFGLSVRSFELESKGVDLHLMKRTLNSTHFLHSNECFKAIMEGYVEIEGKEKTKKVYDKIREIEKRGRYISDREQ